MKKTNELTLSHIDQQIIDLILKRIQLPASPKDTAFPAALHDQQHLEYLLEYNDNRLPPVALSAIMHNIMNLCRAEQQKPKISYLGPKGTFSEQAAITYFGSSIRLCPQTTISDVFMATTPDTYGVVPLRNTLAGEIAETHELLAKQHVTAVDTVELKISQCLLSNAESLESITRIYAHPASLEQCRQWLKEKMPHAEIIPVNSNAAAMQQAATETNAAALGGERGTAYYPLRIVQRDIQDIPRNRTTFLIITGTTDHASPTPPVQRPRKSQRSEKYRYFF